MTHHHQQPDTALTRKTIVVDCEVYHLYSYNKMIIIDDIDHFYLVDLETQLGHTVLSEFNWIQCMWMGIYTRLNIAKSDLTHPVWSIVNKHLSVNKTTSAQLFILFFTLDNILDNTTTPVK